MQSRHTWRFFRAGGFDQVRLDTGADIAALDQLDQKLWVALSCPTRGIEFDAQTLDLIDTDKDGRVRVPEILAATAWTCRLLANPDELLKGAKPLPLAAINDTTPEGKELLASARRILAKLGKPDATEITVEDTADITQLFWKTPFNGDGIVPADAAEDAETRAVIEQIIACLGGEVDRSGQTGVNQAKVDAFFEAATAYSDWMKRAEGDPAILPLGAATLAAAATVRDLQAKVDDFFARGRLAAFDPRALTALNREEKEYLAIAAKDLTITAAEVAGFPLAQVEAGKALPLVQGLNPAWAGAVASFRRLAVVPLLGDCTSITEAQWAEVRARFAAHEVWRATQAGESVESLGLLRIRAILAGRARETITALIAKDMAFGGAADALADVTKLVRYHRDLQRLLVNFVNFRDFYGRKEKAVFQVGTLFLDQRSCDLCLQVTDPARHATMAGLAGAYLVYCDCVRKSTRETLSIVAAFTDGDSDNLMVGRNGIFYDRKGHDWDATITRILDNPISIRQAVWAPYKKFARMVEEQVVKRAATADAETQANLQSTATSVAFAGRSEPPKPKFDIGTIAALGVGLGAIGGIVGGFVSGFMALTWWKMPLALLGVMAAISTPSVILAWSKLRKRNLGPILDANGWAVNAKARINIPFGRSLTGVAQLPPGSRRDLTDPYAEKKSGRYVAILIVLLAALAWALWRFGTLAYLAPSLFRK